MTENVPVDERIERVVLVTVDCLRWDYHKPYRELYPNGVWYRGTPQATYTPASHAAMFTSQNPPRTGVTQFGDTYSGESIFTATNSASFSDITDPAKGLLHGFDDAIQYDQWDLIAFHDRRTNNNPDEDWTISESIGQDRYFDALAQHEFNFVHDWIVHGCGPAHDESIHYDITNDDPKRNREEYRKQISMDISAHEEWLERLKRRGLYENTLFVVWGDHGQSLNEPPGNYLDHGHTPVESVARVPIGFCSSVFEGGKRIDRETNTRGIDILPTLRTIIRNAGLQFRELSHSLEGVDLTQFEGKLAGYTISGKTDVESNGDAVRTDEFAYVVEDDGPQLFRTRTTPDEEMRLQTPVENPMAEQKLQNLRREVRTEPSSLVYRREPDKEWLEAMGYL